tara:strand:- start:383 stop:529 length:147 start_codon:yes stop_codon:yes gene_type:complete
MEEIYRTCGISFSGIWLSISGWLPEVMSLFVALATLIYLIIKIKKELK